MRVGLISTFPPRQCGVGDYTYELVQHLSKTNRGNEFFVNTFDELSPSHRIRQNSADHDNISWTATGSGQEQILASAPIVRRNLTMKMWGRKVTENVKKDCDPDLIHVQSTTFLYPRMFDTFPLFLGKTPLIVTAHDVPHYRQFHMLPFLRLMYSRADSIIVLSKHVARELEHYHGSRIASKVRIMNHGIDIERFNPNVPAAPFHEWLGLTPSSFTLMFFGFLNPSKGIELALHAFQRFLAKREATRDSRLILSGSPRDNDPSYANQLRSLVNRLGISEHVVMTGYVPSHLVPSALTSADALVFPYLGVSQSGPVHRSLASGRPVIVSDLEGFREVVTDGENGLIVKINDVSSIADAIERLFVNKRLRKQIGESARRYAEEHLDWNQVSRETVGVYESVLNSRK